MMESDNKVISAERVKSRLAFQEKLSELPKDEYNTFLKLVQYNTIKEVLQNMKNLKSTDASVWKNTINKLKSIKDAKLVDDESGFDFSKLASTLLPLVGAFAAGMIAAKKAEEAEIKADAAYKSEDLEKTKAIIESRKVSSVVLEQCENETDGFSYEG